MAKIAKTFRLDGNAIDNMQLLINYYSNKLGIKVSQGELIEMLIKNDFKRITQDEDKNQIDLFNLN